MKTCDLFASRDTLSEAIEYADKLIATLPQEHRAAAYTALWVPLNTSIKEKEKASLVNTRLLTHEELPSRLVIAEATPEQAAEIVRHLLVKALHQTCILNEVLPSFGERMTTFTLLVSRMFNLAIEDLIADAKTVMLKGE